MSVVAALSIVIGSAIMGVAAHYAARRYVYDKPAYQNAKAAEERAQAQLEQAKKKQIEVSASKKGNPRHFDRAIKEADEAVTQATQAKVGLHARGQMIALLPNVLGFWIFTSLFGDMVVLRLPFEPLGFLQGMTHRGVPGENYREAGALFCVILSNMFIAPILTMIFGAEDNKGGGFMDLIQKQLGAAEDKSKKQ